MMQTSRETLLGVLVFQGYLNKPLPSLTPYDFLIIDHIPSSLYSFKLNSKSSSHFLVR